MTCYQRSFDYVGLQPTRKVGDLLVLNDDDVFDLLKAAVGREGSQAAFAKRYAVNRSELSSILNGRRRISASLVKALGLRKVYVAERDYATQEREASGSAGEQSFSLSGSEAPPSPASHPDSDPVKHSFRRSPQHAARTLAAVALLGRI